jgi:hypothetical protein
MFGLDPDAMYGLVYLPKSPIMQADGQTQTADLFALAPTADRNERQTFSEFRTTPRSATTQSFTSNLLACVRHVRRMAAAMRDRDGQAPETTRHSLCGTGVGAKILAIPISKTVNRGELAFRSRDHSRRPLLVWYNGILHQNFTC